MSRFIWSVPTSSVTYSQICTEEFWQSVSEPPKPSPLFCWLLFRSLRPYPTWLPWVTGQYSGCEYFRESLRYWAGDTTGLFNEQIFSQGPLYPAIQHLIAFWCPPCEKGRFICVFAGSSFGSLIGHGIVAVTVNRWGWPSSFYTVTVIGALVSVYWMWIVADRPDLHTRVTDNERIYIESAIGSSVNKDTVRMSRGLLLLVTRFPEQIIFHCRKRFPTWRSLKAFQCGLWSCWTLVQVLPRAFNWTLCPVITMTFWGSPLPIPPWYSQDLRLFDSWPAHRSPSWVITWWREIKWDRQHSESISAYSVSTGSVFIESSYKIVLSVNAAHMIPGIIMIGMCFLTSHSILSAALDVFNNAIMGSINLTANQNSQDLSPNFASSIYGIVNFTGSIGGLATLYILALLVNINVSTNTSTHRDPWIKLFVIYVLGQSGGCICPSVSAVCRAALGQQCNIYILRYGEDPVVERAADDSGQTS